jgi:hypothetical protein
VEFRRLADWVYFTPALSFSQAIAACCQRRLEIFILEKFRRGEIIGLKLDCRAMADSGVKFGPSALFHSGAAAFANHCVSVKTGGAKEARTPDLLNAIQTLYQLSYDPIHETER